MNCKLKRNMKRVRKFDPNIKKSVNLERKIQQRRDQKEQIQSKIRLLIQKRRLRKGPLLSKRAQAKLKDALAKNKAGGGKKKKR